MEFGDGFSKTFDIPLSHLDYNYIEKCTDITELEKIYLTLKIGEEGHYPDLLRYCEKTLQSLSPNSRVLRKLEQMKCTNELDYETKNQLISDYEDWLNDLHSNDEMVHGLLSPSSNGDGVNVDNCPIRNQNSVNFTSIKNSSNNQTKKSCKPRDYNEWSKIADQLEKEVIAEEEEMIKGQENQATASKKPKSSSEIKPIYKGMSTVVNTVGMSELEKSKLAVAEKDKGNEAFKAGDLDEALTYYSRSLSVEKSSAVYNNRGLVYMKQKKWQEALKDLSITLKLDPDNIKALQRCANCQYEVHNLQMCIANCQKLLKLCPNSKLTESLLEKAQEEFNRRSQQKLEGGRRMVITEVSSDEEDDEHDEDNDASEVKKVERYTEEKNEKSKEMQGQTNSEIFPDNISSVKGDLKGSDEKMFLKLKNEGNEMFKNLQYDESLKIYNQLVSNWPSNPIGYRNRAACNLVLGRLQEVIDDCNIAIGLDSTNHISYYRRGKAYKLLNDYEQSVSDLEEAFHLCPNNTQIIDELNEAKSLYYEYIHKNESNTKDKEEISNENDQMDNNKISESKENLSVKDTDQSSSWEFLEKSDLSVSSKSNEPSETESIEHTVVTLESDLSPEHVLTKYEFEKELSKIKKLKANWRPTMQLLVNATPANLVSLMGNKLDGFILESIISSLSTYVKLPEHGQFVKDVLQQLIRIQRFNFVKMMISDKSIEELQQIFQVLKSHAIKQNDNIADLDLLQTKYS